MLVKYARFSTVICLVMLLGVAGCSSRSLVVRGTRTNLLKPTRVTGPIANPRENMTIEITKWGPEYLVQVDYDSPGYSTLSQAKAAQGNPNGGPIYESTWTDSKTLADAMKKIGYKLVDVDPKYQIEGRYGRPGYKYVTVDPEYSIEGTAPMGLGPNMAPIIVWDIIMGLPSIVLPVPILGNYTWTVNVKISDGKTGELLSEINKKLDYRLKGLSLWGFIGNVAPSETVIFDTVTDMIDKELASLESAKQQVEIAESAQKVQD
ncbi:MAG: hypothetical protein V1747_01250 [Candidatus Omnitrophota bacterium]